MEQYDPKLFIKSNDMKIELLNAFGYNHKSNIGKNIFFQDKDAKILT